MVEIREVNVTVPGYYSMPIERIHDLARVSNDYEVVDEIDVDDVHSYEVTDCLSEYQSYMSRESGINTFDVVVYMAVNPDDEDPTYDCEFAEWNRWRDYGNDSYDNYDDYGNDDQEDIQYEQD